MSHFKIADLEKLIRVPEEDSAGWLTAAEDSIKFLKANSTNDEIVIYASASSVLIHGVLAPKVKVTPPNGEDLQNHNMPMPDDGWIIQRVWGGEDGHRIYLEPPLSSGGESFVGGEKLIFRRSFDGVSDGPSPIELSQKLVHSLGLYFVPERKAYYRLDSKGDIEDVIKIIQENKGTTWERLDVVTILRSELDRYMALSETCLVWRYDFTRFKQGNFSGWGNVNQYNKSEVDIFYHGQCEGQASYVNGAMIVRPQVSVGELVQAWKDEENSDLKRHAIFKIHDRKHDVNIETSCAPANLANYFQQSDLPWEISPAFFRSEVLHRFKADSEKYTNEDRSISCRNAWYLKSYDINEAGQVHAYIGDLASLPHDEQLYWQAFNEWPKGAISKRAHQNDIIGDWGHEYDPLRKLKHMIGEMEKYCPIWWKPRGDALSDAVLYPATDSVKEWGDEILALDQYLIEGFLLKPLRKIAETYGGRVEDKWATLRVIEEALKAIKFTEIYAKALVAPLQELHALRTCVKGHGAVEKKKHAVVKARSEFGNLRSHFTQVASDCERSFGEIQKVLIDTTTSG